MHSYESFLSPLRGPEVKGRWEVTLGYPVVYATSLPGLIQRTGIALELSYHMVSTDPVLQVPLGPEWPHLTLVSSSASNWASLLTTLPGSRVHDP